MIFDKLIVDNKSDDEIQLNEEFYYFFESFKNIDFFYQVKKNNKK